MREAAVNWAPLVSLLLVAVALSALVVALWWWRQGQRSFRQRWSSLVVLALFLTFDLVVFGAFTRLTDSGLGCPDWPGCYGHASPWGAGTQIAQAQSAAPWGPVTWSKAWIEMVHRYWASTVGALLVAMAVVAWRQRNQVDWRWPALSVAWVCMQGAFGALTVTLKLAPAVVTLHLLGGYGLLALLTAQAVRSHAPGSTAWRIDRRGSALMALVLAAVLGQAALGAWVSSNYAVLACGGFPLCQGTWWPPMDFAAAFALWRPLGYGQDGTALALSAVTAIHMAHRVGALAVSACLLGASVWLWRRGAARRTTVLLVALLLGQWLTGVGNVVWDAPLLSSLLHTAGAGALVVVLVGVVGRLAGWREAGQEEGQ